MVNEANKENYKNDKGIVEEKMRHVLGYAACGVGKRRGDAEGGEVEELPPWTACSHD